jgi:ABC-type nitrate/sulfonate/bicarbonate transport system ATPase subunit
VVLLSQAPGHIRKEWRVEMPHPRDPNAREFVALREEVQRTMQSCECVSRGGEKFIVMEE